VAERLSQSCSSSSNRSAGLSRVISIVAMLVAYAVHGFKM
jgi:hypothetical protein